MLPNQTSRMAYCRPGLRNLADADPDPDRLVAWAEREEVAGAHRQSLKGCSIAGREAREDGLGVGRPV